MPVDVSESRLAALHAAVRRRHDLVAVPMSVRSRTLEFLRVGDPERVLDDLAERESAATPSHRPQSLPYWAELWESAVAIGELMAESPPGGSLLDLGCGMGWAGCVAVLAGWRRVVLADVEREAVRLARLNARRAAAVLTAADDGAWSGGAYSVTAKRVDWRRDRLRERFDRIVGADVLYDRTEWPFLHDFWLAHLAEGGRVLLGEPNRVSGDAFLPFAASRGWSAGVRSVVLPAVPSPVSSLRPTGRQVTVRRLTLWRAGDEDVSRS